MRYLLALMIFTLLAPGACQQASTQTANSREKTTSAPAQTQDEAKRISLKEAKEAFDAGKAVIVDTRAAAAYQSEHIKGAINMPVDEVEKRYGELPTDKQLIFYCS
jgi:3-mercaptopyruvate sulfurtransferase SseA